MSLKLKINCFLSSLKVLWPSCWRGPRVRSDGSGWSQRCIVQVHQRLKVETSMGSSQKQLGVGFPMPIQSTKGFVEERRGQAT